MTETGRTGPSQRNKLIAAALVAAFVAVAAVVAVTSLAGGDDAPATAAGPPLPDLAFERFDGTQASLADYRGRPLVINFWASWCPSCVAEMSAAFRPAQQELGDRVQFLGLDTQDERTAALRLVEETGVLFDLGDDPDGSLYVELGGLGMPFTLFVTADGAIAERHNGPLTRAQLTGKINEHFFS